MKIKQSAAALRNWWRGVRKGVGAITLSFALGAGLVTVMVTEGGQIASVGVEIKQ